MGTHASLRLSSVRGTTPELLGSHRGSVCPLSVAPRVTFGALVWLGKRDSPTRHPLLPLNAGTAEPFRVSPPEAVAYQLESRCSVAYLLAADNFIGPLLSRLRGT